MSPFQTNYQPTHAGQPAGAFSSAPDEEPIASTFDGEGPLWMEAPGVWNPEFASQNAFDSGLDEPWMMPTSNAEGDHFDYTWNYQTNEPLGFEAAFSTQSIAGLALNGQLPMPPFGSTLWMDQPLGQVASTSALFPGQAPIASDGAQSHLQDASFDPYQAGWTNHGAGLNAALDPFADNVR